MLAMIRQIWTLYGSIISYTFREISYSQEMPGGAFTGFLTVLQIESHLFYLKPA